LIHIPANQPSSKEHVFVVEILFEPPRNVEPDIIWLFLRPQGFVGIQGGEVSGETLKKFLAKPSNSKKNELRIFVAIEDPNMTAKELLGFLNLLRQSRAKAVDTYVYVYAGIRERISRRATSALWNRDLEREKKLVGSRFEKAMGRREATRAAR
jgi:hypothetical protein